MREILISFGVLVACVAVLIVGQLLGVGRSTAIAAEQTASTNVMTATAQAVQIASTPTTTPSIQGTKPVSTQSAPEEKIITTESGLQYVDLVEGTGASPTAGKQVTVHYTGTFEDGRVFDSSRDRDEPFKFPIGAGRVIKGWDEGVMTMKVGGRRKLIVPPDLAYGSRGVGPIPPNTTLIFDVELLGV